MSSFKHAPLFGGYFKLPRQTKTTATTTENVMKPLLYALVKLNVIGIALLTIFGFFIGNSNRGPSPAISILFGGCFVYLVYLNIRTVYRARQAVATSIQNSAVDMAASAIEFRDAARARVDERIKEREKRRNSSESNH